MSTLPPKARLLLAIPAVLSLVTGVLSGSARLGVPMPDVIAGMAATHGALMICGFFGTVIGLERAVALGMRWPFSAPGLSGAGGLALIAGAPLWLAQGLFICAALIMLAACVHVWRRQPVAHLATLALGALAWLTGSVIWALGGSIVDAVPAWTAFLLLTIAGERLELSRMRPTPVLAQRAFGLIVLALLAGALLSPAVADWGLILFAVALLALAAWLALFDIARHTVKLPGLTRYMALCLLSGYAWLAVAGSLGLAGGLVAGSPLRDAALHALLLGFVFSMVFGHAPIILPAVSTLRFHWHGGFYIPLALLHAGLVLRVAAGWLEDFPLRQQAGLVNAITLALFLVMVATSLRPGRRLHTNASAPHRGSNANPSHVHRHT